MDPYDVFDQAETLQQQGKGRSAAQLYATLTDHPRLGPRAHLALGGIHLTQGMLEDAERHLRAALAGPVTVSPAQFLLGGLEERRNNGAGARAWYERCVSEAPPGSSWHQAAQRRLRTPPSRPPGSGAPSVSTAAPATPQEPARPSPVEAAYVRHLLGTVTAVETRRETYMGGMSALEIVDILLELGDGAGTANIALVGTRIIGPLPKKDHTVEIDLDRAQRQNKGQFYTVKRLYNHTVGAETTAFTNVSGAARKPRHRLLYLAPVAFVAVAGLMLYAVLAVEAPWKVVTSTLTVPVLEGMTMSEAGSVLERAGFEGAEYTFADEASTAAPGTVFASQPAAGAEVQVERRRIGRPTTYLVVFVSNGTP